MADDNKEKDLNEELPEENATDTEEKVEVKQKSGDDWSWDASVQTNIDNLTVEKLTKKQEKPKRKKEKSKEDEETTDKDEEEAKDEKDKCDTCIVCGKSLYGSSSELYCTDCCAKFLKTQYGVGHIILAFVMVVVAAFSYFVCVSTVDISAKIFSAQTNFDNKLYEAAIEDCTDTTTAVEKVNSGVSAVLSSISENLSTTELFSVGTRSNGIRIRAIANEISINYYADFIEEVDGVYSAKQLAQPKNADIKACYDFCKSFENVYNTTYETLNGYIYGSSDSDEDYEIPYEEVIKYLDSVKVANDSEKSAIAYYKAVMAYSAEKDADEILKHYDNAYKLAGDFDYMLMESYIYLSWENEKYDKVLELASKALERNEADMSACYYAVKSYLIKNDLTKANEFCEKLKVADPEGLDYYSIKAEVLRREGKFEDAVNICKKGLELGEDSEIYRQQAIAYMLLDKNTEALEAAKQTYNISLQNAYSGNNVSAISFSTAALIAKLCDDTDTYDEIVALFTQQGMELEDSVQSCIKGDIPFEEIFMEGTGDIR